MAARTALVLTFLLPLIASSGTAAQPCPASVPPNGNPEIKYGPRAGGRYCDGQPATSHGGRLRIISLTASGPLARPQSHSVTLKVRVSPQLLSPDKIVTIQGLPLQAARNYRLDASLRYEQLPLVIGGEAALWQLPLIPSDIGWAAWTQEPGEERIYWPIHLGDAPAANVKIIFRSSILLGVLRVSVHEPATNRTVNQDLTMAVNPNEPIPYELPPGSPGLVTVDIVADGADGVSSEALSFRVWRPGP